MQTTRERWGCDAPTETPRWKITCTSCHGARVIVSGDGDNTTTEMCEKCVPPGNPDAPPTGFVYMHRCPGHYKTPEMIDGANAYSWLKRSNEFPVAGGMEKQSPTFISLVELFESERSQVQLEEDEEREASRKKAK